MNTFCKNNNNTWFTVGVGLGVSLGVAFDHLAEGTALGAAFGVILQGLFRPKA